MKIISLKELQDKFTVVLETVPNKIILINNEIKEIESYLNFVPTPKRNKRTFERKPKASNIFELDIPNIVRDTFINAFYGFYLYGKFKIKKNYQDTEEQINFRSNLLKQAYDFVEYYKWLKKLEVKPKIQKEKSSLNIEQKLLALQLLGLDLQDYNNNHSAKALGQILNVGSENIRKNLSNLYAGKNNVRTPKNLEKLLELFQNKTFDSITNRIKKELKK